MRLVKYLNYSGEIVGVYPYKDNEPGFGFIEVDGTQPSPSEYFVKNGSLTLIPNANFTFDREKNEWGDHRSVDEARESKWKQVKAQRDAAEFGSFVWSGYAFDGDESAQRRINLAVMGAQAALIAGDSSWSVDWTLADNTSLTLSASDMIGVANALGANIAQAHALARVKRQQIEAAQTVAELDSL